MPERTTGNCCLEVLVFETGTQATRSECNLFFVDETWVNAHHTLSRGWYDTSDYQGAVAGPPTQPVEPPTGKGKRIIVLHAGGAAGWVPTCEMVLVGKGKSLDYHDEINGPHFEEWW